MFTTSARSTRLRAAYRRVHTCVTTCVGRTAQVVELIHPQGFDVSIREQHVGRFQVTRVRAANVYTITGIRDNLRLRPDAGGPVVQNILLWLDRPRQGIARTGVRFQATHLRP